MIGCWTQRAAKRRSSRDRFLATGLCLALLVVGCGRRGPEVAPVTGKVTIDGQTVTSGSIQFWPASGRAARGQIQEDGAYTLTTFDPDDGALLGEHVVTIRSTEVSGELPEIGSLEEEMEYFSNPRAKRLRGAGLTWIVPERYSRRESSGLTATVVRGNNTINWELRSKPK